MQDEIKRFNESLFDSVELLKVSVGDLKPDDTVEELFRQANPIAGLRNASEAIDKSAYLFNLLALQSPIICYRYRKYYKTLTGSFTLEKLRCAKAQGHLSNNDSVLVFVLTKKPSAKVKRAIVLFDLTNDLLSKCFISDTKKISFYLRSWFIKDQGKRSIYQSSEWQIFFPELTSAEKLANFLSISKADL